MSDLPSHPDSGPAAHRVGDPSEAHEARDAHEAPSEAPIAGWSGRRRWLVAAAAVGVLVLFAVLHLTGVVGSEGH